MPSNRHRADWNASIVIVLYETLLPARTLLMPAAFDLSKLDHHPVLGGELDPVEQNLKC